MNLSEIPTSELRRILRITERDAGLDSVEALILRRELDKRKQQARKNRKKGVRHAHGRR